MLLNRSRAVFAAKDDLGVPARGREGFRIEIAIDGVAEKKPAEEEHLGREEDPHPELRGFVLLLELIELFSDERPGGSVHLRKQHRTGAGKCAAESWVVVGVKL